MPWQALQALVFWEGLLGGAVYVNAFGRIHAEVPREDRELSLLVASCADSAGINCAAWLSLAATALVAGEPSGLSVFCRAPDGRWLQGPKLAAPDGPGVPGLWLSLHAFANAVPVAAESSHAKRSECTGFALRSDGYLGLWRVSLQAGPAQPPAFEWVGQAEISGATCATPLVRAAGCNGRLGRATARRLCLLGQTLTVHSGWLSTTAAGLTPNQLVVRRLVLLLTTKQKPTLAKTSMLMASPVIH